MNFRWLLLLPPWQNTRAIFGSTLAAAEAVGYESIGVEEDPYFFELACRAIPALAGLETRTTAPR